MKQSYKDRNKWTAVLHARTFKALARITNNVLLEVRRGCLGYAPPPSAIIVLDGNVSWCYWKDEK
jgi:hypothetical protein